MCLEAQKRFLFCIDIVPDKLFDSSPHKKSLAQCQKSDTIFVVSSSIKVRGKNSIGASKVIKKRARSMPPTTPTVRTEKGRWMDEWVGHAIGDSPTVFLYHSL